MSNTYQIYLISDSTGETLDRIFLALKLNLKILNIKSFLLLYKDRKSNFKDFRGRQERKFAILYTIVDNNLAKYLANKSDENICFGVLGNLNLNFSKFQSKSIS